MHTDYKYIIWDWNGTLINDTRACYGILCAIINKYNKTPVTYDQYRDNFCFPVITYYQGLGFDFSVESYDDIVKDYIENYRKIQHTFKLHDQTKQVLTEITGQSITQFILSAFNQNMLDNGIKQFELENYFTKVIGQSDNYANSKIILGQQLIKSMSLNPSQGLIIGDTTHDFDVAQKLKMDCILISSGHQSYKTLKKCNTVILDCIGDIPAWLNQHKP